MSNQIASNFNSLKTQAERASWLIGQGITTRLSINPEKMCPAYQARSGGISMPGYFKTEESAIEETLKWLNSFIAESPEGKPV